MDLGDLHGSAWKHDARNEVVSIGDLHLDIHCHWGAARTHEIGGASHASGAILVRAQRRRGNLPAGQLELGPSCGGRKLHQPTAKLTSDNWFKCGTR
jgi:hypothetical protein